LSTSGEPILFDTSAALALASPDHLSHTAARRESQDGPRGLSRHAAFELLSVLTRLPQPRRLTSTGALALITHNFPASRYLPADRMGALVAEFVALNIVGGQVHDGLVGACARHHRLTLLTCDTRAEFTYRRLGVRYRLLEAPVNG